MKPNEAPEKLYCVATEGGYYLTTIKSEPPFTEAVEYTRTDVFIEKAIEWLKGNLVRFVYPNNMATISVSNSFFAEFHKAMEE